MPSTKLRAVHITVSAVQTGETYLAKSYPDNDFNNNGMVERYRTPVYRVFIDGQDSRGLQVRKEWKALRFMPYWNDPAAPSGHYKARGWVNSGKRFVGRKKVTYYDPRYSTQNTFSPFSGAIQIEGNFLIHAGPEYLTDEGWGAAGCVEIIGNFEQFKSDISGLSGSSQRNASDAIAELVNQGKLTLQVDQANPPNLKKNFAGEVMPW